MTSNAHAGGSCGINTTNPDYLRAWTLHLALIGDRSAITQNTDPLIKAISAIILHDPDAAIQILTSSLKSAKSDSSKAAYAYWASRAWLLKPDPNHKADALIRYAQSKQDTFYGQLAGTPLSSNPTSYPHEYFRYIDPRTDYVLVWSIIRQESRFHVSASSSAGALGLMQVIPSTARSITHSLGSEINLDRMTKDPHYAVAIGSTYLGHLYDKYRHNIPLTLSAYNAGEGCAEKWIAALGDPRDKSTNMLLWIESVPYSETREYIHNIMANYVIYKKSLTPTMPQALR